MKSLKVTLLYVVIGLILSIILYAYGRLTDQTTRRTHRLKT